LKIIASYLTIGDIFKEGASLKNIVTGLCAAVLISGCGGDSSNEDGTKQKADFSQEKIDKKEDNQTTVVDHTSPTLTLKGGTVYRLLQGKPFIDPGYNAVDNVDGQISQKVAVSGNVDTSKPGKYKLTYSVQDKAGNKSEATRDVYVFFKPKSSVYINEFLANNNTNMLDPDYYAFSDWIELYNDSDSDINISGYSISDSLDKVSWTIPADTVIKAHSYKIIWADKKASGIHTDFSLGRKGEEIAFYDKAGTLIDYISYKKQKADISYGRNDDLLWEYMIPSYNSKNRQGLLSNKRTDEPLFSKEGGFYTSSVTVSLDSQEGADIYYTTDGSFPNINDKSHTMKYTAPIKIDKTTTLRARAYKNGRFQSKDVTNTYLIDHQSDLPVVTLATNPDYLFDDMIGIYVKGKNGVPLKQCRASETEPVNYAQDWQRPIHIEFFDEDKKQAFSFNLDIAITGQCSRHNPKKSLSLELDSKYGKKSLKYGLYPSKDLEKIKDFRLRTGDLGFKVRDLVSVALVEDAKLNVDYEAYRAVKLFINAKYWGIYNIREKKGLEYLKSNYPDINTSKVDMIGIKVKAGNREAYDELDRYVKSHDLSIDTNYRKVLDEVDIDNFIDYMIIELYSGNNDWPFNNFRVWRERDKPGAKWRWVLEDLDYGFVNADANTFDVAQEQGVLTTDLFGALLKNPTFKAKFKKRFNDLLSTAFEPDNVIALVDKIYDERKNYMDDEPAEWGITLHDLTYDVDRIRSFANKRPAIIKAQLDKL